ncbi:MAG TPA: hypothetical protein VLL28_10155 [Hyphomicrobiaceae bacterium]|nr:hypothetical protein [Hyphomicrobiaceae bacterium]
MSVVQFPVGTFQSGVERVALRRGLARPGRLGAALQLVQRQSPAATYCASCAAPIDFGAVWRGDEAYCSVECSLGGNLPA